MSPPKGRNVLPQIRGFEGAAMLKAYLAYSSEDKTYVDKVAHLLGRALVIYDTMCFEPGHDIRDLIINGLVKSRLFVFFASKRSLASTWVKFEIDEATWKLLRDEMGGALTIVIDKDIYVTQLPQWMQRSLAGFIQSPTQAARVIRERLIQESGLDKQPPFLGRESDLAEFAPELIARPEEKPRRLVVISGLDGVGRRTFARRALKDYLSLAIGPILILEETASLDMLHLKLLDEVMESSLRSEVARTLAAFAELPELEKGHEIARLMALIAKNNVAPVLVDRKALLDDHGRYLEWFTHVLEGLTTYEDTYLVIIHNRRPDLSGIVAKSPGIAFHRLDPLNSDDTELLLRQVLRMTGVSATNNQVKTLVLHMGGYPPTVELASTYAKFYGLETLLSDKSILADFRARTFAPMLSRLQLEPREWEILRMLAGQSTLPLEVITEVLCIQADDCARTLRHLIDLNLVVPADHQFAISSPLREAVEKLSGSLTKADYERIALQLRRVFWKEPDKVPPLAIVDATIHALARSGMKQLADFRDLILPSQLYRVAREEYHARNWSVAIQFALRTLNADPSRDGARIILCKAYAREELWPEAEQQLRKLENRGVRAQFYCKGFLEWKRGNLKEAISAFKSALDAGDNSISVYRDLAHCLYRSGDTGKAKAVLYEAPEWIFRNSYVISLAAQIAIAEGDWNTAEPYISELEHIATREDFHYRRATLRSARRQWTEALQDAEVSCASVPPRFECMAQRADILIELSRLPEAASAIEALVPIGVVKRDVKMGLKCKLLLRQGKWQEAKVLWQGFHQKESPVAQALQKEILKQKVADIMTAPADRKEASQELEKIGEPVQLPLVVTDDDEE